MTTDTRPIFIVSSGRSGTAMMEKLFKVKNREEADQIEFPFYADFDLPAFLAKKDFEMTDEGRPYVERAVGGCYTGGIDAHMARGWRVAENRFVGIYCAGEGLAEHAVHFWVGSRDTVVERIFRDVHTPYVLPREEPRRRLLAQELARAGPERDAYVLAGDLQETREERVP